MMMKKERNYIESVHFSGRIWMLSALALLVSVPIAICLYYSAWPKGSELLQGLLGVAPIFWTVSIIEVFTFVPMLGAAGSYLGFVTGNLTNLKVPCALNAMRLAKVKPNTEEGELISTIAIATSSIVTTLIIAAGVLLLAQLQPILESPLLAPAFSNILPALFGALGVVLIAKDWKVAIAPIVCMSALFIIVPSLSSAVGILVPVSAFIAIGVARILYKKNLL